MRILLNDGGCLFALRRTLIVLFWHLRWCAKLLRLPTSISRCLPLYTLNLPGFFAGAPPCDTVGSATTSLDRRFARYMGAGPVQTGRTAVEPQKQNTPVINKGFLNRRFKHAFAYFSRGRKVGAESGAAQVPGRFEKNPPFAAQRAAKITAPVNKVSKRAARGFAPCNYKILSPLRQQVFLETFFTA